MMRFLKAAVLTAFVAGPLILALWLPRGVAAFAVIVYLAAVLGGSYVCLTRREREESVVRDAELDAIFDGVFSEYEADLSRFPFRVHVFRRSGMFPIELLEMVYHYRTHSTDPDRELRFYRYFGGDGQGLVWQSCQHGDIRYFRRADVADTKAAFHLRGAQDTATREVAAILTLPLRQLVDTGPPARLGEAGARSIGVLSFDALSPEAADALGQLFVQFRAGEQPALAELADRVSLYVR
jgi:hypothetical protein